MASNDGMIAAGRYMAFGVGFAVTIVTAVLIGYYADRYLNTSPLFILVLTVGGMIGAVRRLLWSLKKITKT